MIYYGDLNVTRNGADAYTMAVVPFGHVHWSELSLERDGGERDYESGQSHYMGQAVNLWLTEYGCIPSNSLYVGIGEALGEEPDYGWFYEFFNDADATLPPSVTVTSASIPDDNVSVTVEPFGDAGPVTVQLEGDMTHVIYEGSLQGGYYGFSFDIPNLPGGREFTQVRAIWEANGTSISNTRSYHFKVLGDYINTRYNTPTEAYCSGGPVDIGYVTGTCTSVQSCSFTNFQGKSGWWDEVLENGGGLSLAQGMVSREWVCTGAPRRVRRVPAPCPSCPGVSLSIGNSVARNVGNPDLPCGARLYVDRVGIVTVADSGGGLAMEQLDHYAGASGCNRVGGSIGTRKVIRLF